MYSSGPEDFLRVRFFQPLTEIKEKLGPHEHIDCAWRMKFNISEFDIRRNLYRVFVDLYRWQILCNRRNYETMHVNLVARMPGLNGNVATLRNVALRLV